MNQKIPPEILPRFVDLWAALSPENLTCDGEASPAHVRQRTQEIRTEWAKLEEQVGFKVSEDDVDRQFDWGMKS